MSVYGKSRMHVQVRSHTPYGVHELVIFGSERPLSNTALWSLLSWRAGELLNVIWWLVEWEVVYTGITEYQRLVLALFRTLNIGCTTRSHQIDLERSLHLYDSNCDWHKLKLAVHFQAVALLDLGHGWFGKALFTCMSMNYTKKYTMSYSMNAAHPFSH